MQRSLALALAAVAAAALACGGPAPAETPTEEEAASPLAFFAERDGTWFGSAALSPFGEFPYAWVISAQDGDGDGAAETVVARADPPEGMGLPPGAFQEFVFDADGMRFESSLTGEIIAGQLVWSEPLGPDAVQLCNTAAEGGCDAMAVTLKMVGEAMHFDTALDGEVHASMHLKPWVEGAAQEPAADASDDGADAPSAPIPALLKTMVAPGLLEAETAPAPMLVAAVVTRRGAETEVMGFGKAEALDAPGSALLRIGSVTKPFTGLLAATHVVAGRTESDALVLPGVTLEELIRHVSGMPVLPDNADPDDLGAYTEAQLEAFVQGWQPGDDAATFTYSTAGYAALGWVLADLGQAPFADQLEREVLAPLGLTSTTLEPDPAALSPGHDATGEALVDPPRSAALSPSGSLASTADDLARLVAAYLDPSALPPELAEAMALTLDTDGGVDAFPGSVTARGWFYFAELDAYWHAGSAPGSTAFVAFSPRCGAGVVLLVDVAVPQGDPRMALAAFQMMGALAATGHCAP